MKSIIIYDCLTNLSEWELFRDAVSKYRGLLKIVILTSEDFFILVVLEEILQEMNF